MILADTSVWMDHFRGGNSELRRQLEGGQILMHPFVAGELALGSLRNRAATLSLLDQLPQAPVALIGEVRMTIEGRALYGLGIGLTDAHLIASVFLAPGTVLWTRNGRLRKAGLKLGIDAGLS